MVFWIIFCLIKSAFPLFPIVSQFTGMSKENHSRVKYDLVIPDMHNWPIARFFQNREQMLGGVSQTAIQNLVGTVPNDAKRMEELIAEALYQERIRMSEEPWKVDPKDEKKFWKQVKYDLVTAGQNLGESNSDPAAMETLLHRIIHRYTHEISSNFKPGSYHFAKRVLPFLFSTLLNASAGKTILAMIYHNLHLQDKIHLRGEIELLRTLAPKTTVVLVPTHFSNVDSILIGWGLHALGLPAFIYGAGLNLYNNRILGYFMQRLGAYKVDRRKRNPIYQQCLRSYSLHALQEGVHSLFFPGGTRSRSGAIEDRLKLGLMGTAIEAQKLNVMQAPTHQRGKIVVVPLVMSYHFVLEARSLINQYLKRTGKEQYYLLNDEFASYRKFLKFTWTSLSRSSEIVLAFGKPMDIFGNFVDENGESFDERGNRVEVREYFTTRGEVIHDAQRDQEYTRMLGGKIVERYRVENRVFSSHLVAYVAFELLKKKFQKLDLYGLLRLPEDDRMLPYQEFLQGVERVYRHLKEMEQCNQLHLAEHMVGDIPQLIGHGIKNLGIYHSKQPLKQINEDTLTTENMNLLYFYHNRLEGYDLSRYI